MSAGRIRSIKPEWLEDERLAFASPVARVLSIGLVLLADDYGNGRANVAWLRGQVFPGDTAIEPTGEALAELARLLFVRLYEVDGQSYFQIRNWSKHQRVDKPGKPRVPPAPSTEEVARPSRKQRATRAKPPETPGNVPESLAKAPEVPGNVPGGLAPDRDQDLDQDQDLERGPGAGPVAPEARRRQLGNFEKAMAVPVQDRCAAVLEFEHMAQFCEPHRWPEVVGLAETFGFVLGLQRTKLAAWRDDRAVRALVLALSTFSEGELERIGSAMGLDPWCRANIRSLPQLSLTVLRRLLELPAAGSGGRQPDYEESPDFDFEEAAAS